MNLNIEKEALVGNRQKIIELFLAFLMMCGGKEFHFLQGVH